MPLRTKIFDSKVPKPIEELMLSTISSSGAGLYIHFGHKCKVREKIIANLIDICY